jgi:two-component system chemotaxis response regulator CheB
VEPIAVLVVDDSVVVRRIVANVLSEDPEIRVVGTAASGRSALEKIERLAPDILTLDIEMPDMDGLETLRHLRQLHPRLAVIMFSTLTQRAAAATLEALSLGACDYVTKPGSVGSTSAALETVPFSSCMTAACRGSRPTRRHARTGADQRSTCSSSRPPPCSVRGCWPAC